MTNIAIHIRIFEAEPADDFVDKRTSAIKDLSAGFAKRKSSLEILQLANDLAEAVSEKGNMPTALAGEIEGAIRPHSTAFVQEGQELQMLVCALLAALQYLETAVPSQGPKTDILAAGLWSALSHQPPRTEAPKLEALRIELLELSQSLVIATSSRSRNRTEVPDIYAKLPEPLELSTFADALTKGSVKTIKSLRDNAALDREELDLLWWVLSDWSTLLNDTLSSSQDAAVAIARGLEAARLLRRLPGDAHKHLVLKGIVKGDPLSMDNLIKKLGDNRAKLAAAYLGNATLAACPAVFPLLVALSEAHSTENESKEKRSLHDWAGRALLESAILHVTSLPISPVL